MSNIIVELSNKTSSTQQSNGDFETVFSTPIIINQGDVIQIKNAFIDTIQQTYDQIYLPNDIPIKIKVCYYEFDVTILTQATGAETTKIYSAGHVPGSGTTSSNWQMYLAFQGPLGNRMLLTGDLNGFIPKGLYTPQSLAIEITKRLTLLSSPASGNANAMQGIPFTTVISSDPNAGDYTTFVKLVTNTDPTQCNLVYADYYNYQESNPATGVFTYYTGARQVAVTYDDQGDNKFQFQYLHTPCYDDNGNMTIQFASGATPLTRETGCMLLDLQPRGFWTSLGFNVPSMIPVFNDYTNVNPRILYFDNSKMTTEALFTIDDMYGNIFGAFRSGMFARQVILHPKIATYSRGMSADQFYSFARLSPFLLVEFITNYNGMYLTGSDKSRFISAVVSRNYTQNNYITGYSDSSIIYEHKGESFMLSNIRTRILDPDTKDVENDIGANNYIILQVIKNS